MRTDFKNLLSLLLLLSLPALVEAQFNYTTNNGTITITRYTDDAAAVTIPSKINGLPVTSIGAYAFSAVTILTSVTIPPSVTGIGDGAFYRCTSLTSVTIPASLTSIGYATFANCSSLPSVTIPPSVSVIGDYAFLACTSLRSVALPLSVTSIGNEAFEYCTSLTNVVLPPSLIRMGYATFANCSSLTSVAIPPGLTSIGSGSFGGCTSLTEITVDAPNSSYSSVDGVLFDTSQTTLIQYPGGKAGSYTVPNSVTSIGSSAFFYCTSLTSVTIPSSVTSIGDWAFRDCSSLTGVYFQGDVPSIDSNVFYNANNATIYYLPETMGWNPQMQTSGVSFGVRTNRFGFAITGTSGLGIVVQACTNLVNPTWSAVGTNALTGGSSYFSDPQWTNYPARFYRLRSSTFGGRQMVLWRPQVQTSDGSFGVRTNQFGFTITWASGKVVVVEASTNLASPSWYPLQTNILTGGSSYFSDPQWRNYTRRFYRLRSL